MLNTKLSAQIPCNNIIPPSTGGNLGIGTTQAYKPIHIKGWGKPECEVNCSDPTLRLEYDSYLSSCTGDVLSYFGHLALTTTTNFNFYSTLTPKPTLGNPGDLVLQAETARDIVLTTRNPYGRLRFATTPTLGGADVERMRISNNEYTSLIDIKRAEIPATPNYWHRNSLLRFMQTDLAGNVIATPGSMWKVGIDGLAGSESTFKNLFKIGADPMPSNTSSIFDNNNTAITIKPNNLTIIGHPDANFIINNSATLSIISKPASNLPALYTLIEPTDGWRYSMINFINGSNASIINNTVAFTVVNALNQGSWRQVFTIWGNGETDIDGKVHIGDGSGTVKKQQNHLDARLSVDGTVVAKEIFVVVDNWSDYVFNKDYALPELTEVENHIKANGHLPGIPSEKEVKENGISLGEMNAKLLQKIEELTLYLIDMKKSNQDLTNRIQTLEIK